MRALELAGQRFGRLVAIRCETRRGIRYWVCACDCGGTRTVVGSALTRSRATQCANVAHRPSRKVGPCPRTCAGCGAGFEVGKPSERNRFCSTTCWYTWQREQTAERRYAHLCAVCGVEYRTRKSTQRTCSRACQAISFRKPRVSKEPPAVPGCRWIPLTRDKFALVDEERFDDLSTFAWCFSSGSAVRNANGGFIYMHHVVLPPPTGMLVDHRNGDRLDNRRDNLRYATVVQNMRNVRKAKGSCRFKGVSFIRDRGVFQAHVHANGRTTYLGQFCSAEDAAHAYDAAALSAFGEFACLNFPPPGQRSAARAAQAATEEA